MQRKRGASTGQAWGKRGESQGKQAVFGASRPNGMVFVWETGASKRTKYSFYNIKQGEGPWRQRCDGEA